MGDPPAFTAPEPMPEVPRPPAAPSMPIAPPASSGEIPWVPPSPGYEPPGYQQPGYQQHQPYHGPVPPAPPKHKHPGRTLVIVLGSVAVGGLLIWAVVVGVIALTGAFSHALNQAAGGGTESATTVCSARCYSQEDAAALEPKSYNLALLGLDTDPSRTRFEPTPIGNFIDNASAEFFSEGGSPDGCDFLAASAPVHQLSIAIDRDDVTLDLGSYVGQGTALTETVRVFWNDLYASRHTGQLRSPVIQCATTTRLLNGERVVSTVEPANFDVPDGVAIIAWTETSPDSARTVVDLQYSNLVIRLVYSAADSAMFDRDFPMFVFKTASDMKSLYAEPPPVATCTGTCFSARQAVSFILTPEQLSLVGNPTLVAGSAVDVTPAGIVSDNAQRLFRKDYFPPECRFLYATGPVSATNPGTSFDLRANPVYDLGTYTNDNITVTQSARAFENEAAAVLYLGDVKASITACPQYPSADVSSYDTPLSHPSAGWRETSTDATFTVVDQQRGNLVIRTTINKQTHSSVSDDDFARLLGITGEQLTALSPASQ